MKMRINYNITGPKRKKLVEAISKELETEAKYLAAPSFAYQIGDYIIDRNGALEGNDNPELVAALLGLHDFKAVSEEYDVPLPKAESVPEDLVIPHEAELGGRISPYRDYEEPPLCDFQNEEADSLIIELPMEGFTSLALNNLKGLIEARESLIKKALGIEFLPIITDEENISFPWFSNTLEPDEIKAYTNFIKKLYKMARKQKRVITTEKIVENERYAFRCFLLRLGFIGEEYKADRKILLRNLRGSSAFKNGQSANKEAAQC